MPAAINVSAVVRHYAVPAAINVSAVVRHYAVPAALFIYDNIGISLDVPVLRIF